MFHFAGHYWRRFRFLEKEMDRYRMFRIRSLHTANNAKLLPLGFPLFLLI